MTRRTSCTAAQSVRASGSAAASDYAATRGARQSRTISLDWDDEPGVDERVDLCGHLCRRCCRLQLPALPLPPPPERVASTVQADRLQTEFAAQRGWQQGAGTPSGACVTTARLPWPAARTSTEPTRRRLADRGISKVTKGSSKVERGRFCRSTDELTTPCTNAGAAVHPIAGGAPVALAGMFPTFLIPSAPNSFLLASAMFAMGGVSWDKCLLVILVPWMMRLSLVEGKEDRRTPLETRPCDVKMHGKRDDRVNWAAGLTQGKRPAMEDYFVSLPGLQLKSRLPPAETAFLAVFDGHGGWQTGAFLTQRLHEHIASAVDFGDAGSDASGDSGDGEVVLPSTLEKSLEGAYLKADLEWMEQAQRMGLRAGSTATTALLLGNLLICPNVGDSRTVICTRGTARAMSEDHKPDLPRERYRIEALGPSSRASLLTSRRPSQAPHALSNCSENTACVRAGGRIIWYGCYRVEGDLAISRSFGDKDLKRWVTAQPDFRSHTLCDGDEFLLLASDGLWDVLNDQ